MFSTLTVKPLFFTLDNRLAPAAAGAYPWTPMHLSDPSGILQQSVLNSYLDQFYQQAANWTHVVTSAFPGFHDIYQQAGVHNSYGYLDPLNGYTLKLTLQKAVSHHPNVIQIQTWNDYGEGTIIEPTVQFGTRYLEIIQSVRDSIGSFPFIQADLQMPLRIYRARVQYATNPAANAVLDRVFNFIISSQPAHAKSLLDSLLGTTLLSNECLAQHEYVLGQNYPNPFNPTTTISYQIPKNGLVSLVVYDALGTEVATLVNEEKTQGKYSIEFNALNLPSGVYFYTLRAGDFVSTKKLILMK
jgi:hypothetical protein